MASDRGFMFYMYMASGTTFLFVPRSRSSFNIKVKYQDHIFQELAIFDQCILFCKALKHKNILCTKTLKILTLRITKKMEENLSNLENEEIKLFSTCIQEKAKHNLAVAFALPIC